MVSVNTTKSSEIQANASQNLHEFQLKRLPWIWCTLREKKNTNKNTSIYLKKKNIMNPNIDEEIFWQFEYQTSSPLFHLHSLLLANAFNCFSNCKVTPQRKINLVFRHWTKKDKSNLEAKQYCEFPWLACWPKVFTHRTPLEFESLGEQVVLFKQHLLDVMCACVVWVCL